MYIGTAGFSKAMAMKYVMGPWQFENLKSCGLPEF